MPPDNYENVTFISKDLDEIFCKLSEIYYEYKPNLNDTSYNPNNIANLKRYKLYNDSNSENIIPNSSKDDNALLNNIPKFKNSITIYQSKYKTISLMK